MVQAVQHQIPKANASYGNATTRVHVTDDINTTQTLMASIHLDFSLHKMDMLSYYIS